MDRDAMNDWNKSECWQNLWKQLKVSQGWAKDRDNYFYLIAGVIPMNWNGFSASSSVGVKQSHWGALNASK